MGAEPYFMYFLTERKYLLSEHTKVIKPANNSYLEITSHCISMCIIFTSNTLQLLYFFTRGQIFCLSNLEAFVD